MIVPVIFALLLVQAVTIADCETGLKTGRRHGSPQGLDLDRSKKFTIVCPFGGAFTGVNYWSSEFSMFEIEIVCTSSQGKITFGPYGSAYSSRLSLKPIVDSLHCPDGEYISSFSGTVEESSNNYLKRLGFRCRPQNDMKSAGKFLGSAGANKKRITDGADFDEKSLSVGRRPVYITVNTADGLQAIQIRYAKTKIDGKLCSTNCVYKEKWAEEHGFPSGEASIVNCPAGGALTGIKYLVDPKSRLLAQLTLICTSALGETLLGPYGGSKQYTDDDIEKCDDDAYVSSIHGVYNDERVSALGLSCKTIDETDDGRKFEVHGRHAGKEFDDLKYSSDGRPVEFIIRHNPGVIRAIRVKYGNMPISINCHVARIEVKDTITADDDGYEVIGVASQTLCENTTMALAISYASTVEESTGVETSDGGEVNWSKSVSFSMSVGVTVGGSIGVASVEASLETTVGTESSKGGSRSWSNTQQKSTTNSKTNTVGGTINFSGPVSAIYYGTVHRYKINRDKVPVLYHFKCKAGALTPHPATIKLSRTTYAYGVFDNFSHQFKKTSDCTQAIKDKVAAIKFGKILTSPMIIKERFFKCFGLTGKDAVSTGLQSPAGQPVSKVPKKSLVN